MPENLPRQVRRVTLVASELRVGGMERVVVHLAKSFRSAGIASSIICLEDRGPLAAEAEAAGVPVAALKSFRGYDLRAALALAREIRRLRPDVIHLHDRSSLLYAALARQVTRRRPPLVFTAHGLLLGDGQPRWRDRLACRAVDAVTAVSDPTATEYARLLAWRGAVEVIGNGVPIVERGEEDRARVRRSLDISPETFVFLAVGNLKPEKGYEDLLAASEIMKREGSGRPFQVLIAGGAAGDEYQRRLTEHAKSLNGKASFLGSRSDVALLYSAADALVLSSRKEGLPLVLLEAMSAGLPVVATRVGAVPDVVRHEATGLLVSAAAPGELAGAMTRLQEDPRLCRRLGHAARQRVVEDYSVQSMSRRYLDVYEKCLAASAPHACRRQEDRAPRPRILQLGPLPPMTGGMAAVIENLLTSDLVDSVQMETLNNGKTTRPGRTLAEGIAAQGILLANLARKVVARRIQVVHLHTCEFFGFWRDCIHALAVACLGCRVIWHVHGGGFHRWAAQQGLAGRTVIRVALERAAAVIVLSDEWQRRLKPFAPKARWHVVSNAIRIPPEPSPLPDGRPRFLFLGNWSPRKGIADLVEATAMAVREHDFQGVVQMAGFEKEPGQRERLDRQIAQSGCASQLEVLGLILGEAKDEAIRQSHCLLLPSYSEGLPISVLEAMGCGRAVIATRVGAIPELITEGVEGLLIEPGDISALAQSLARLASDREELLRMGLAGRQRVERDHSFETMIRRVAAVYEDVLGLAPLPDWKTAQTLPGAAPATAASTTAVSAYYDTGSVPSQPVIHGK